MTQQLFDKLKANPVLLAGLVGAFINGLRLFGVYDLTDDQGAWLNGLMLLVFGVGIRSAVTPNDRVVARVDPAGKTVAGNAAGTVTAGTEVDHIVPKGAGPGLGH